MALTRGDRVVVRSVPDSHIRYRAALLAAPFCDVWATTSDGDYVRVSCDGVPSALVRVDACTPYVDTGLRVPVGAVMEVA